MARSPPRSRSPPTRRRGGDRERDRRREREKDSGPRDRQRDRDRDDSESHRHSRDYRHHRRSASRPRHPKPIEDSRSANYSPPPLDARSKPSRSISKEGSAPPSEKEKPNFSSTGLLAAASNTVNNVVLKYSEPGDSRLPPPSPAYKLFVFKDSAIVETIELNSRACWLIGRDRAVADLPVDHPSCSKQHAVLQFRFVTKTNEFGDKTSGVRLYVMDLESANGTNLNGVELSGSRFVECRETDLIKFGLSTREYVIMLDRG